MQQKSKFLLIDIETTGTDPKRHGIWQMAGQIYIDNEVKETFNFTFSPFQLDFCDEFAVKMSGKTEIELRALGNPRDTYNDFIKMLSKYVDKYDKQDKFFFVGYNAMFDMNMLRSWFEKCMDKYFGSWFWFPPLDVMALAAWHNVHNRSQLPDFKLGTICDSYGIKLAEGESLHDANVDIRFTYDLLRALCNEEVERYGHFPPTIPYGEA